MTAVATLRASFAKADALRCHFQCLGRRAYGSLQVPISLHALASLPLVKTVDDAVDSFLTEWQLAAHGALMAFAPGEKSNDADRQWWIAFAGNMLWAWTVFCPATAAGSVTALAKLASILGAAIGSGVATKLQYERPDVLTSMGGTRTILA